MAQLTAVVLTQIVAPEASVNWITIGQLQHVVDALLHRHGVGKDAENMGRCLTLRLYRRRLLAAMERISPAILLCWTMQRCCRSREAPLATFDPTPGSFNANISFCAIFNTPSDVLSTASYDVNHPVD